MNQTIRNTLSRFLPVSCIGPVFRTAVFAFLLGGSDIAVADPTYDLVVEASANTTDVNVGQGYVYMIGALNSSAQPSAPALVKLVLPAGVIYLNGPDPDLSTAGLKCQQADQVLSCNFPSVPASGHALAMVHVLAPTSAGTIVAPVSLVQQKSDGNPQNDATTVVTTVHAMASAPDLEITQHDSADPVLQNAAYSYSLQVRNIGSTAETSQIDVYDPLPAGTQLIGASGTDWNCYPLPLNTWVHCIGYFGLAQGASAAPITIELQNVSTTKKIVLNTASVSGSADTDTSNNLASEQTQLGLTPGVDLTVTQHDDVDPVSIGAPYHYLLTMKNVGDRDATAVTLTDTLPSGSQFVAAAGAGWACTAAGDVLTCTRSSLASLEDSSLAIQLLAPPHAGIATNSAVIQSEDVDAYSNNQAIEQTTVLAQGDAPDLKLVASAPALVETGTDFAYSLTVSNIGPFRESSPITLNETLPANVTFKAIAATGWSCKIDDGFLSCVSLRGLQAGEVYAPVTISVTAPSSADIVVNTAVVTGSADADPSNNLATVFTKVQANTAPLLVGQAFDVAEDQVPGFVVGTVQAQDDSLPLPTSIAYSLEGTDVFVIDASTGVITLAKPLNFDIQATYTFTVAAYDGALPTKANVTIHVIDVVTNTPPIIFDQVFSVAEDHPPGSFVGKVFASDDQRPPPGVLTYAIVAGNSGNAFAIDAANGDLTVNKALDFETLASYALTVQVSDGQLSSTATVAIAITDVVGGPGVEDNAPIAGDDAIQVAPLGTATSLIGGATSVLANDDDADAGETATLTVDFVKPPQYGTLSIQANGTFQYTNTANIDADSFQYQACDIHNQCTTATVRIRIYAGPMDRLPIAVDDAIQVPAAGTATSLIGGMISVLANDFDLDGDLLTARVLSAPHAGTLTFSSDGKFTYINTDGAAAVDGFAYEACDPYGACTRAIVSVTISDKALNHLPLATEDTTMSAAPNGNISLLVGGSSSVLQNDGDVDPNEQATLRAVALNAPDFGTVTLNGDGSFVYKNSNGNVGHDAFWYEACDIHGACAAAKVTVSINTAAAASACTLPVQVFEVGDAIQLSLVKLFTPPPGQSLKYSVSGLPFSIAVDANSGALSGTPGDIDGKLVAYNAVLKATTVPGDATSSQAVGFYLLPEGELLHRDGFDLPPGPCQ